MDPLAGLLVIILIIIALAILCRATKHTDGLNTLSTSASSATLSPASNILDASTLVGNAIQSSSSTDTAALLRQALDKLQFAGDSLGATGAVGASLSAQVTSAKQTLQSLIDQTQSVSDVAHLQALQRGGLTDLQTVLNMFYNSLQSATSTTIGTVPTTVITPTVYYAQPYYTSWQSDRPYPLPRLHPGPGPRPPMPGPHPGPRR